MPLLRFLVETVTHTRHTVEERKRSHEQIVVLVDNTWFRRIDYIILYSESTLLAEYVEDSSENIDTLGKSMHGDSALDTVESHSRQQSRQA